MFRFESPGNIVTDATQPTPPVDPKFDKVFSRALDKLVADAKAAGLSMNDVAKAASTSSATPYRWRKKAPLSVETLARMQTVVADALKAKLQPSS